MNDPNEKCVMVIDGSLPQGVAAHVAAILGVTQGPQPPAAGGGDVRGGSGRRHLGIIAFPVPILRGNAESLRALRERLWDPQYAGLTAVDFSDFAQGCRTYAEFTEGLRAVPEDGLRYLGLAVCGEKKLVNRLTGSLPLLR